MCVFMSSALHAVNLSYTNFSRKSLDVVRVKSFFVIIIHAYTSAPILEAVYIRSIIKTLYSHRVGLYNLFSVESVFFRFIC